MWGGQQRVSGLIMLKDCLWFGQVTPSQAGSETSQLRSSEYTDKERGEIPSFVSLSARPPVLYISA